MPTSKHASSPAYLHDGRMVMLAQSHPDLEPGFAELYPRIAEYSMTSVERMYALYGAIQYVCANNINGDIVECGVWRGGSAMLAALALRALGDSQRRLLLFDTYSGMTEPTHRDQDLHGAAAAANWEDIRSDPHHPILCLASLQEVQENLATTEYPEDLLVYVEGRVEDTLPEHAPHQAALLHLDTDWYESTYHELKHLYPRLARGGVVLIDDYGHWSGARQAVDDYFANITTQPLLVRVDYTGRIGIKLVSL